VATGDVSEYCRDFCCCEIAKEQISVVHGGVFEEEGEVEERK
jgi:hypothetical protein